MLTGERQLFVEGGEHAGTARSASARAASIDMVRLACFADEALDDVGAGFRWARRTAHLARSRLFAGNIGQAAFLSAEPGFIVLCSTASMVGRS